MAFVRADRLPEIKNPKKYVPSAPDLAVEVLSPNDRPDDGRGNRCRSGSRRDQVRSGRSIQRREPSPFIARAPSPLPSPKIKISTGGDVLPGFVCRVALFFA